jgi:hypothetical protein
MTVFMAMAMAMATVMGLAGSGSASAATGAGRMLSDQRIAPAKPAAGPYLAVLNHLSGEIASDIGHPLSPTISVVVNSTQQLGAGTLAYADAQSTSGNPDAPATKCVVAINPSLYHAQETALTNFVLAHEVFHCFEAMDFPTVAAFGHAPDWLVEGEAEWVGDTIAPREDTWWNSYLEDPETSLFSRSYNAVGFYALMSASGDDTWHLLDPMLRASGNAAAYAVASTPTLDLDWASSLTRQSGFGAGWDATGPGITDARYNPDTTIVKNRTILRATVAPYTNAVIKFNPAADVVDVSGGTVNSRLHEADGDTVNNPDNEYCVHQCDQCPEMQAMPKLESGTNWLTVTGNTGGATYSVAGKKAQCSESCMVGSWTATSMVVTADGGQYYGGAGTIVVISLDGLATANFTPGQPFQILKFDGTETAVYTFPANPKETSGKILVGNYNISQTVIEVNDKPHGMLQPGPGSGTFDCMGTTGLTLNFPAGFDGLTYTLVRNGPPPETQATTP